MEAPPNKAVVEMNATLEKVELWKKRSSIVTEFAGLLGTKSVGSGAALGSTPSARAKALRNLFSDLLEDHDVALTLPSMDLGLLDSRDELKNPLPEIGEHCEAVAPLDDSLPRMAASVLTSATEGAANSEQKAAQNIGKITSWTKSTIDYASDAIKKNVSSSFASLVDSRVRAWTLLLLRHSLSTGDDESRTRLLSMLASCIQVDSVETVFKTLPLPDSAAEQARENEVILPLLFEVGLEAAVQDKHERISLRAPGTVSVIFDPQSTRLKSAAINLTSVSLLNSMVEQARMIVLKTVASATKTQVPEAMVTSGSPVAPSTPASCASNLTRFRSALTLNSPHYQESPSLLKARSSALRLNGVLHHQSDSPNASLGIRKVRSVKWESPMQPPKLAGALAPSPKKQRTANACKLKSFKSFGRPHAGDFGSGPNNATFSEYDRGQTWGRNGRLAHHPMPMQSSDSTDGLIGRMTHVADKNATFDQFNAHHRVLTAPQSSTRLAMPRTTTALEMFLLKKSTGPKVMN